MFAYVRFSRGTPEQKLNVGLVFIVLNAVAVALLNTWDHASASESLGLLSWNTVVILVSAMIMPASPGKMLVASLIAATTDPLAVVGRASARSSHAGVVEHARAVHAQLRVRRGRLAAVARCCSGWAAGCARRRTWAATT